MFKKYLFHTRKIAVVLFFLSFFSHKSQAQEKNSVFDQTWFQYYNKAVFSEKWSLSTDVGYRLKEGSFVERSQYFVRTGLGYQMSSTVRFLLGTAMFNTHTSWDTEVVEFRPYQEVTSKHKFGRVGFGNRIRVEERFVNVRGDAEVAAVESFNFRFRYRFLFTIPLLNFSKTDVDKKINLVLGDELIASAGKSDFLDFSAQNRILVGPSVKINKHNTFSLLYNFTSVTKDIPKISDEYGVLWVGYKQTLDFNK